MYSQSILEFWKCHFMKIIKTINCHIRTHEVNGESLISCWLFLLHIFHLFGFWSNLFCLKIDVTATHLYPLNILTICPVSALNRFPELQRLIHQIRNFISFTDVNLYVCTLILFKSITVQGTISFYLSKWIDWVIYAPNAQVIP